MRNKEDLKYLAKKFLEGTASAEEKAALNHWYTSGLAEGPEEELVFTTEPEDAKAIKTRLYQNIRQKLMMPAGKKTAVAKLWPKIAVAASLFFVAGMALYFFLAHKNFDTERRFADAKMISAGTNTAVLTLANGQKVNLSGSKTALVINASGVSYSDGDSLGGNRRAEWKASSELTVSTPKGGQYQVVLPDGTKIWLNAASVLKFPARFDGVNARRVELTGEAYFEVAKIEAKLAGKVRHSPFIVATGEQEVEVLGTHFNINAYTEEGSIRTTLFEGSVRVSLGGLNRMGRTALLRPGQQAMVSNQEIAVNPADIEEALAWRNGFFKFNRESIPSVMRKLSRWYNVEVVYEAEISKGRIIGTISRSKNIKEVLEMLEETKLVTFKVEGRKVIVR
ncbi:FecR family protein [Pedobacter africanus]|uniref:FecR family protein n=1 Tax=Pedobacter africanus TaxID=151894 RepID=A0A1W1ZJZ9_9SPHI|nr:FecR domain-containing protein [Pedobacter africanus]SMC48829.1 FecR family protein [Pedobacter africanus]